MKTEFTKKEINEALKIQQNLQENLQQLNDLCFKITNNEYLMRTGVDLNCSIKSNTIDNGKTKITLKLTALMPSKNSN